jgi:predicted nuclease with RNAse H fold
MKLAGLDLAETDDINSAVAVLSDGEVRSEEFETNEEILDFLEDEKPEVVAVNSGMEESRELGEGEEELEDEGFIFTAAKDDTKRVRRFQDLEKRLIRRLDADERPEFVRYAPMITSRELAIDSDAGLESYGIETGEIRSSREMDAVLGAVTARFYQQGQVKDMGVIVPEPLSSVDDS